jgi:hypothetical protein
VAIVGRMGRSKAIVRNSPGGFPDSLNQQGTKSRVKITVCRKPAALECEAGDESAEWRHRAADPPPAADAPATADWARPGACPDQTIVALGHPLRLATATFG